MQIVSYFAIYFIIWWVTLFAVLPFGIRSQKEAGEVVTGSDPGAPIKARILRSIIMTTTIAAIVFGLFWVVYAKNSFDLQIIRDMSR